MDLVEALSAPRNKNNINRTKPGVPKVGDPGTYEWNGTEGVIYTKPTTERVTTWDKYLIDSGLDPETVEVVGFPQIRGWDAIKKEWNDELEDFESNVVRMHYYKLNIRERTSSLSVDELLSLIKKSPSKKLNRPTGEHTFVVAIGDIQAGKCDGDGVEGTLQRAVDGLERAAETLKTLRKYKSIGRVHVAWLGDCIEGFVSQNGMNAWRTTLTLTEQIRLLRRLQLLSVEIFSPLAEQLDEIAVGGNHDQAIRFGKGGVTRFDDSFDVEALVSVADAVSLSQPKFNNTHFYTPEEDELSVTLETSGTIIGHIHGHQTKKGKHWDWWAKQSLGDQPIGQADILLAGHFHHFIVDTSGFRKFIQVPALEQESTWFRHTNGVVGDPGILTFVTKDKTINNIEIV